MAIAFQAASSAVSSASASSSTITWPGSASLQLLLAVFGFEGVASGSGPWITSTVQNGWSRCFYQPPSASGCGLEVWNVQEWTSGPSTTFNFDTTHSYVGQGLVYTGQFTGSGNVVRASVSQPWTGNNPEAPSIYAFVTEMVVVAAADLIQSPGYGTPTPAGWTSRSDSSRGSTFGNVEIASADKLTTVEGDTAAIPWAATASSGTTKGSTGTLAIRAATTTPSATSPAISVIFPTT